MGGGLDDTDAALAAFGLKAERPLSGDLEVWPEHGQVVEVFGALLTQWRYAPMGGITGLDYGVIPATLDLMEIPRIDRAEIFGELRIMEAEAIKVINA